LVSLIIIKKYKLKQQFNIIDIACSVL